MTEITGDRVKLRPFKQSDITDEYLSWLNDPVVTKFSNQRFREHDRESALAYLGSFAGTRNLFYSIHALDTDEAMGTANAFRDFNHGVCDAGIVIGNRKYWGGGYGQEAWNLWVDWILTEGEMRKITAGCFDENTAARKMVERSGMEIEGVRPKQQVFDGRAGDVVLYAKFAD